MAVRHFTNPGLYSVSHQVVRSASPVACSTTFFGCSSGHEFNLCGSESLIPRTTVYNIFNSDKADNGHCAKAMSLASPQVKSLLVVNSETESQGSALVSWDY